MQTSCQTCPENENVKIENLDPGFFPELPDLSGIPENKLRVLVEYLVDIYSEHMELLLSAKATGQFTDDIDLEIEDCRSALEWLELIN